MGIGKIRAGINEMANKRVRNRGESRKLTAGF